MQNRDFWVSMRHTLLMQLGAIEKLLGIKPTTKEIRDWAKAKYGDCNIKAQDVQNRILEIEHE